MTVLSGFEVLAENLFPDLGNSGKVADPFLVQGYFVQISLSPDAGVSSVTFNLIFEETTKFTQGFGQKSLMAQIIQADGTVVLYDQFFASVGNGFLSQSISAGQTLIYGVQCLPPPFLGADAQAALPQAGTGWRGTVQINASASNQLIATPTQRLVYYASAADYPTTSSGATVYPVPTASGGTII